MQFEGAAVRGEDAPEQGLALGVVEQREAHEPRLHPPADDEEAVVAEQTARAEVDRRPPVPGQLGRNHLHPGAR